MQKIVRIDEKSSNSGSVILETVHVGGNDHFSRTCIRVDVSLRASEISSSLFFNTIYRVQFHRPVPFIDH